MQDIVNKYHDFSDFLYKKIVDLEVEVVVYENVMHHAGVHAAHAYGGYLAMTEAAAWAHGIEMVGVGVTQIKKFWAGSGAAKKEAMIAEAIKRGYDPTDDNAADALAILHYFIDNQQVNPVIK